MADMQILPPPSPLGFIAHSVMVNIFIAERNIRPILPNRIRPGRAA